MASGLPMPRHRTFASAFQASALSVLPALRHPCLRWSATPALAASAAPHGDSIHADCCRVPGPPGL